MSNRLKMAIAQAVLQLHAQGWSFRRIARELHIDLLGRQTEDLVTSLGSSSSSSSSGSSSSSSSSGPSVDRTVQRIARTYEVRGLFQNVTSYSSPIIGQGTVVNDVERVYNSFEQLITEYQEHSGAVNTSTSVNVQYQYANGSSNTIRPTAIIYPNGRQLNLNYGTAGAIDDALSRVASLIDSDGVTHLADYTRIGFDTFVAQSSPQPQIAWSLVNGTGVDPYTGLDQFDRVVDSRWYSTATNGDLDRIQHGYDRASNRLWRRNTVAEAVSANLDELYAYNGLYRLTEMQRGQLNSATNAIVSGTLIFAHAWGLDATGNWLQFWQNDTGASWDLQQSRGANRVNEITSITGGGWAPPAYDAAGNTHQMPQPSSPSTANSAIYDAWDRMTQVWGGGALIQQNAYDGENRRVTKLAGGTFRHCYFSAEWQSLEERLGPSTSPDRQFVWGLRYIDNLILRDCSDFTPSRLYEFHDPNWNVTAICSSSGTVSERYAYTAYGEPAFLSAGFALINGSAYDWETLFGGYCWDPDSGLYLVRARWLHSLFGCWLSRDVLDGTNLYSYCNSSPLTCMDPSGMFPCDPSDWAVAATHCRAQTPPGYTFVRPTRCDKTFKISMRGKTVCLVESLEYTCEFEKKPRCTKKLQTELQNAISAACKGALAPKTCDVTMTPSELLVNANKFKSCYEARKILNDLCFGGGNKGHRQAADDYFRGALTCLELLQNYNTQHTL